MKDENGYSIHEFKTDGVFLTKPIVMIEVDSKTFKLMEAVEAFEELESDQVHEFLNYCLSRLVSRKSL